VLHRLRLECRGRIVGVEQSKGSAHRPANAGQRLQHIASRI
jgi:hypothetical protein